MIPSFRRLTLTTCLALGACPAFARAAGEEVCPVPQVIAPRPADPAAEPAWVSKRVAELQPNAAERKIDRIGWAGSVLEAEKLAAQLNRPVFLFTLDGRMDTGRC
jgi:hypothetical protein